MTREVSNTASSTSCVTRIAVKPLSRQKREKFVVCKVSRVKESRLAQRLVQEKQRRIVRRAHARAPPAAAMPRRELMRVKAPARRPVRPTSLSASSTPTLCADRARPLLRPGRSRRFLLRPTSTGIASGPEETRIRDGSSASIAAPSAAIETPAAPGRSRPATRRNRVDLPQPEGPSSATCNSPAATLRSTD